MSTRILFSVVNVPQQLHTTTTTTLHLFSYEFLVFSHALVVVCRAHLVVFIIASMASKTILYKTEIFKTILCIELSTSEVNEYAMLVNLCRVCVCVCAVSYTHLDVYKRQA